MARAEAHSRRTCSSNRRIHFDAASNFADSFGENKPQTSRPCLLVGLHGGHESRGSNRRPRRERADACGQRSRRAPHRAPKTSRSPRQVLRPRSFPSPRLRRGDICDSASRSRGRARRYARNSESSRNPDSCSSGETTRAFCATDRSITKSRTARIAAQKFFHFLFQKSKQPGVTDHAVLDDFKDSRIEIRAAEAFGEAPDRPARLSAGKKRRRGSSLPEDSRRSFLQSRYRPAPPQSWGHGRVRFRVHSSPQHIRPRLRRLLRRQRPATRGGRLLHEPVGGRFARPWKDSWPSRHRPSESLPGVCRQESSSMRAPQCRQTRGEEITNTASFFSNGGNDIAAIVRARLARTRPRTSRLRLAP